MIASHWHIRTRINHSQDLGISIKTRSIICKTWTYQDSDQSFTRFWHIKTLINCSQDLGISRLWSIICKTWAYPNICPLWVGYASLANDWSESCEWLIEMRLCQSLAWLIGVRICPNLVNDWSKSGYVQILQTIDQSLDMPKSCKWLIGVWICQCLANDWLESRYAKLSKMIEQPVWIMQDCESLESTLKWSEQMYGMSKGYVLNFSLSQVLWYLLSVIALCEEKIDWRKKRIRLKAG